MSQQDQFGQNSRAADENAENERTTQDRQSEILADDPSATSAVIADEENHLLPFPIVAIGASAGGLEAYIELLQSLPPDTGMAFVIVPHLSPEHASHLAQILAKHTSMPVREIEHGMRPEPNQVFVLRSNVRLSMERGLFSVEPRAAGERMPIDRFFRSLAADQKNRVVGIVLSGADSDGALGLKYIKGEGGIAMVQDPESARFGDMPRSSILADHVDIILPPAQLASELSRVAQQFFHPSLQSLEGGALASSDEPHFARILTLLRSVSGVEFRNYRPATLRRRMARRMILRRIDDLSDYARFLNESREELRNLHEDVLIGVTRFFRDPSVFDALIAEVLPTLFGRRSADQQVRIWVAGCSSGEEVYSIAMCVLEFLSGQPLEPPIQIFGTDASDRSIDMARAAQYPDSIAADISPERLRRFFLKTDKGFQVAKRVRDLCIFARQNLCNDPPFSRLDLISCRNVLIYLQPDIQRTILHTFHYALRSSGCLLLGRSESVPDAIGLFTALDRKLKFYRKHGDSLPPGPHIVPRLRLPDVTVSKLASNSLSRTIAAEVDAQRVADQVVVARYGPPGVLVDEDLDVLDVRGRPAPFLAIAPGAASLNVLRMAHGDIMPTLRSALQKAMDTGAPAVEEIAVNQGEVHRATLEVLPVRTGPGRTPQYLVLFVPEDRPAPVFLDHSDNESAEDSERELVRLRRDLTTTRQYLQSLIEERDARNQELTAAYEELQSANEELQSTNEELETAKEELQSTNEELQTVNEELRNRNLALVQASNDLSNLLTSVNIPVIMLGSDLTIRQFTTPAEKLVRLRPADIGRPIGEIRLNLQLDDIEPLLHEVVDSLITHEREVQDRSGRWHLLRLRPYRTNDNKIEGVVMALLDIDQMRRIQEDLEHARDFAQTIVEAVQVPVIVLDKTLEIRSANAAFRAISALGSTDLNRRFFPDLLNLLWGWPDLTQEFQHLIEQPNGTVLNLEHEAFKEQRHYYRLSARGIQADGKPAVLVVLDDVTAQRQHRLLLETERERLSGQVQSTTEVLIRTQQELRALAARLFLSQEEERRRVARDLHDDICQKLAVMDMDIERLSRQLPIEPEDVRRHLQEIRERMAVLSDHVRTISHQLHPSALAHLGLAAALKSLVDDFGQREGVLATFRQDRVPDKLPEEVSSAFYRIAQEALRNVAKHAGQAHVKVMLEGGGNSLTLVVRDSGEGFDLDDVHRVRGLGLVSMEERAHLIGGKFTVVSALGEGTTVTVTVPLATETNE
jgi:two-component system CheB/CheR fusion protein